MEIVDTEEKIEAFLPLVDAAIREGLATIEKVRIRLYRSGVKRHDSEDSQGPPLTVSRDSSKMPGSKRRDDRVAEGARLESVCGGNLTVGSNPTLSANFFPGPAFCVMGARCPKCSSTSV